MRRFIIRNDDVSVHTRFSEIVRFCEVCDAHGYKIIQAITPLGAGGKYARAHLTNDQIRLMEFRRFDENTRVYEYLKSRDDYIAVHGLWHTHAPTLEEVARAKEYLIGLGFNPTYFVPPFNEGEYPVEVDGLTLSQLSMEAGERLEDFLTEGEPNSPIVYLHSWRFAHRNYNFDQLDACLARLEPKITKISDLPVDPIRHWYNDWVSKNALGRVLDIGKSRHWDYGFETLDANPKLNPTYVGSTEQIDLPDETFDTVLCNGMYEFVTDHQAMVNEAVRLTKKGGTTLFGFVGPDYTPYKKDWKYFDETVQLPPHTRMDFGGDYVFFICPK